MAEAIATKAIRRSFQPSFFFWMTVIMACFVFSGFGLTYLKPLATGTLAPLPPAIHVHGLFYFSWMILLIAQAFLVNVKNVPLHRSVGTFGIVIATGLLILGTLITILFGRSVRDNPSLGLLQPHVLVRGSADQFRHALLPGDPQHAQA